MDQWWKDEELIGIQKKCDHAVYTKNSALAYKLSQKCFEMGHDKSHKPITRASYLYSAATCLLDIFSYEEIKTEEQEKIYERCLYLFRTANDLCQIAYEEEILKETENTLSNPHIDGLYFPLIVNYANLLSQCGRYIKSISTLSNINDVNFPMAIGNLALKIADYSSFDESYKNLILYKAYKLLKQVLETDTFYPERHEAEKIFTKYLQNIQEHLGKDFLEKEYSITDFVKSNDNDMSNEEQKYRTWFGLTQLSLNHLNTFLYNKEIAYDPLHLPSMIEKINSSTVPKYHALFNQIKQEYVSARFWIYEGLKDTDTHFSDKEVYLVNTLDYPIYGISIEKMKAAYRSIYSIFDKIAYFLNLYLNLGINKRSISFHTLWFKRVNKKDIRRESTMNMQNDNYALDGLWWIYKDLRNKTVYDDKYIDPVLKNIREVRHAMEHKIIRILDYYGSDTSSNKSISNSNNYAYTISFDDFEHLTIELLQLTREAIIQLTMIIQIEETKKKRQQDPQKPIGSISLSEYDDDWKRIW